MTKGRKIDAAGLRVCLEADEESDVVWLEQLCSSLGLESIRMNSEKRKHLHLSAVFANNFTNQMYAAAEEWMTINELPFDLLHPLIRKRRTKPLKSDQNRVRQDLQPEAIWAVCASRPRCSKTFVCAGSTGI